MLDVLPLPPTSRLGWPWTEESDSLPATQPDGKLWPTISIITPSLNQGIFIEETIRSILLQNYPNLEYVIIDGGSTDNTLEIIKKYEPWLTYWISEPDKGQSHAINKGFSRCHGKWVNWICSDDMLCKNAFTRLAPLLVNNAREFITGNGFRINEKNQVINEIQLSGIKNFDQLIDIKRYWRNGNSIFQQSTLCLLEEIKKVNFLNENNHLTMDYELWGKLLISGNNINQTQIPVGIFRWYKGQKTSMFTKVTKSLTSTAISLVRQNQNLSFRRKLFLIFRVRAYRFSFNYHRFRSFLGIKRRFKTLVNG